MVRNLEDPNINTYLSVYNRYIYFIRGIWIMLGCQSSHVKRI